MESVLYKSVAHISISYRFNDAHIHRLLFVASRWMTFISDEKRLRFLEVRQFPIGIILISKQFKIFTRLQVLETRVMGEVPSVFVDFNDSRLKIRCVVILYLSPRNIDRCSFSSFKYLCDLPLL